MAELIIENEQSKIEFTEDMSALLQRVCDAALQYEECDFDAQISITIVDDEEIHAINKEHRGIDKPTDVLSFPMLEFDEDGQILDNEFEYDSDGTIMLGDIVISLERAKAQAAEYGHSMERELAFLCTHSMLHLLGYDHVNSKEEEDEMFARQEAILRNLGIERRRSL